MPFSGLSRSGDQVFGECGGSYLLPLPSLLLSFLGVQVKHLLRWILNIQNPRKTWLATKPAWSLVDDDSLGPWLPPSGAGCPHSPVPGRGWAYPQPTTSAYSFDCEQAGLCISLGLFAGVATPGSGLLSQVSSLRLPSGHSGLDLTLSNAARTSFPSPHLLVADAGICTASLLGITIGHVICGFKLFIYFSSHLCCLLGSKARHKLKTLVRVFPGVWKLLYFLRLPSPDESLSLPLLSLFLYVTFFPTSFQSQWAAFLGAWCPLPTFRSSFVAFTQRSNVLLMNLLGRKCSPCPIPLPS